MTSAELPDRSQQFLDLHRSGQPLLLPNPWDAGSARVLAGLGFAALATTSSGFAATMGRADGEVTADEALAHAHDIAVATDRPVNADLENGFADEPAVIADVIQRAIEAGVAGASIEDYARNDDRPIYDLALATERIAAAAAAAHGGSRRLVLTARAENYLHDRPDLDDTIARLVSYQEAGADVVYAPGLIEPADIAAVVAAITVPLNVLAFPTGPSVAQLADLGVSRISVGGAFAYAALGALVEAAEEFRDRGTYSYARQSAIGREAARAAFG